MWKSLYAGEAAGDNITNHRLLSILTELPETNVMLEQLLHRDCCKACRFLLHLPLRLSFAISLCLYFMERYRVWCCRLCSVCSSLVKHMLIAWLLFHRRPCCQCQTAWISKVYSVSGDGSVISGAWQHFNCRWWSWERFMFPAFLKTETVEMTFGLLGASTRGSQDWLYTRRITVNHLYHICTQKTFVRERLYRNYHYLHYLWLVVTLSSINWPVQYGTQCPANNWTFLLSSKLPQTP